MTGEESLELSYTFGVGWLETAEESGVDVGGISGVTVSGGDYTTVYTGRIAVPDLNKGIGDGIASRNVNHLGVKNEIDSLLFFDDVCSDIFTRDV